MKKKILASVVCFLVLGCTAQAPSSDKSYHSENDQRTITTSEVDYFPENENVTGYLAAPEGEGPFPALILIHEWWGLNENIRDFADRFARQGYVALAVDLYEGEVAESGERAGELAGQVRSNTDPAFQNLRQAIDFLRDREEVDENFLASVGWCFGGGWAYQMAKNDLGVEASVMYYGHFDPEADFEQMKATILGHFGEEDRSISVDDVRVFRANLKTASGDHEVYIYPNAGHAFANEDNPESYNPPAAKLAWERTLEFLTEEEREAMDQ
ncbi:dienelactone hydrolase family protein [Candidatus Gracilibacteria bacterium]|nr:dienelactone hydrolase family protein [Candidatus Gracilibacteria bacterium]MCF7819241.1 dienelactone hydrolase family protein [Candidatus Gracilibacteria bacterium]